MIPISSSSSITALFEDETPRTSDDPTAKTSGSLPNTKYTVKKAKDLLSKLDSLSSALHNIKSYTQELQGVFIQELALRDVARKLSAEESGSASFKMNCKLARGYLEIILRTKFVEIKKDQLDLTLRKYLFTQFIKDSPAEFSEQFFKCFDMLKELPVNDTVGYKKILSSFLTETHLKNMKSNLGENALKAIKALLNQPVLMGVSLKEIFKNGLVESHPSLFKRLAQSGYPCAASAKQSLYDSFTNSFGIWLFKLENPSYTLISSLVALWEKLKQGDTIPAETWSSITSPLVQETLKEFQTIHNSIPISLLKVLDTETIFTESDMKASVTNQLDANQLCNSYTLWCHSLEEICKEQKGLVSNLKNYNDCLLDVTFMKTQEMVRKSSSSAGSFVVIDKKKHRKQVQGLLQTDDERQFIRICLYFEQTCARKLISLNEEVALLKKAPQQVSIVKWGLFATIEPLLQRIQEIKDQVKKFEEECKNKMSRFSITTTTSTKAVNGVYPAGTTMQLHVKPNKAPSAAEMTLCQMAHGIWSGHHTAIQRFQFLTQNWIERLQQDLEACFYADNNGAKKVFSKEALRKKIAYETLHLPDLIDIESEMFDSPPPKLTAQKTSATDKKSPPKKDQAPPPSLPSPTLVLPAAQTSSTTKQEALDKELMINLQGFEKQLSLIDVATTKGSLTGVMAPYAVTTAQLLREAMTKAQIVPFVHSRLDVEYTNTIQECCDHFFLLTQGMELISSCILQKRFDLLLPAFRAFLIDGAVAVEQRFAGDILLKKQKMFGDHHLELLADESSLPMNVSQKEFLRDFHRALIWARYPVASLNYFSGSNEPETPAAVQTLKQLLGKGIKTKESLTPFVNDLFKNYQRALSIILGPVITQSQAHLKFAQLCDTLRTGLIALLNQQSSATALVTSKRTPFSVTKSAIDTALRQNPMGDPDATQHLQEIASYLQLLELSEALKGVFPDPNLAFWHLRNDLEIEKPFKHLYEADCLLNHLGAVRRHGFGNFVDALKGVRDLSGDLPMLKSINMKIANHYHTMPSPLGSAYPILLQQCQASVQGFELAAKAKASFPNFKQIFALFEKQLVPILKLASHRIAGNS